MKYSEYRLSDGTFTGKILEGDMQALAMNILNGMGILQGEFNPDIDRVDLLRTIPIIASGSVKQRYQNKPDNPFVRWDKDIEQWKDFRSQEQILEMAGDVIKRKRLQLLVDSDWTDTLSAKARLGESTYSEWQTYRQALRDITKQSGYPLDVTWPVPPQ